MERQTAASNIDFDLMFDKIKQRNVEEILPTRPAFWFTLNCIVNSLIRLIYMFLWYMISSTWFHWNGSSGDPDFFYHLPKFYSVFLYAYWK